MLNPDNLDWQKNDGLLPAIVQDADSSQVLMLGYMNRDALARTLAGGCVTFYSRSKQRLWTKGESSGHYLHFKGISADCDRDTLLILATPIGATCHTGAQSCFHQFDGAAEPDWVFLARLEQLIAARKHADPESSYTARLYAAGSKRIAQKVGEEGVETALAAATGDKEETINEAADLTYHLTVLLQHADLSWADVIGKLKERHG